jgi:5-methylcytosine-specific restriction endonuclease McrA
MGKKVSYTPRSKVRAALRQLWLRSRERAAALKRDNYTCQHCHKKQTLAKGKEFKVSVHHIHQINNWDKVIDKIYEEILCNESQLMTVCDNCHDKIHENDKQH